MNRIFKISILLFTLTLFSGCELLLSTKEQRQEKRGNKKMEKLVKKYPSLLEKDTIHDTIEIIVPEIRFDTIIKISKDMSGVDSILNKFETKLDSVTKLKLGDEIKYYITQRKVLEDTMRHIQDDLEVLIWQDGDDINVKIKKPEQIINEPIIVPVDRVVIRESNKVQEFIKMILKYIIWILVLIALLFVLYKIKLKR